MRKPPSPPNIGPEFWNTENIKHLHTPQMAAFVQMANERYLHWDKLRYQPRPPGVEPELAWVAVDISRSIFRAPLPISFYSMGSKLHFWNPPKHLEWLHRIDSQAHGTIGALDSTPLPQDERYLFNSLMEEAIASSQLEGASTTRQIAKKMLQTSRKARNKAEQMIVNNYNAILEIRDSHDTKLTPEWLCHLQSILTHETLDPADVGRFRTDDDNVVVADSYTDEIMHTPPSAGSLKSRIQEVCDFSNTKDASFIHPVVKGIILHFAMGFIHPFVDGNGRTARALFYWWMLKNGYWLFEYLPISRVFLAAPARYMRAYLRTENDNGDATYFIHYNLTVIIRAIDDLHKYLQEKQGEYREATKLMESFPFLNHRQSAVIRAALKDPHASFTISNHRGVHHVSYRTARMDLIEMADAGLLTQRMEGKRLVFTPALDLVSRIKSTALQREFVRQRESSD